MSRLALKLLLGWFFLVAIGCEKGPEESSVLTEYLEVDFEHIPPNQFNSVPERPDAAAVIASGEAVKLTFFGAARIVGGACTLVEYRGRKLLVDAGIFYVKSLVPLDQQFQFDPSELDWVILTHAHGDHNGRLPLLYRRGYAGRVYGSAPTRDICRVMLELAASIGIPKYRIDFANSSVHNTNCDIAAGLGPFDHLDVRRADAWYDIMGYHGCPLCREKMLARKKAVGEEAYSWFETVPFGQEVRLADDIRFRLHHAGHILGSSQVELVLGEKEEEITLVFTGDIGNRISPVLQPPVQLSEADYLISESTYGAVRKEHRKPYFRDFEEAIVKAVRRGERVIIPAFVLSKSQKVLTIISELAAENRISQNCPIIVTSPTVAALNEIYDYYLQNDPDPYFTDYLIRRQKWRNPFQNPRIFFGSLKEYVKKHGEIGRPAVLLVSSGMMDFASSLEMAERYLGDPKSNFFIVGWQSPDSVGRAAMDLTEVVIRGRIIPVLAQVLKFGQFSSHGDLSILLENVAGFRDLKGLVVHHGEPDSAANLAYLIHRDYGIPIFVPAFLDTLYLDKKSFLKVTHDTMPQATRLRQLDPILELPEGSAPKAYSVAQNNLDMAERARLNGDLDLALQYARGASIRYPEMADAHFLCGRIHLDRGEQKKAIKSFQTAIDNNPYDFRPYLALASIQVEDGRFEEAIENLRTCLFYSPESVKALALLGDIYSSAGKEQGLELLKAANRIDPYDEEVSAVLKKNAGALNGSSPLYIASEQGKYFHYPWCETARKINPTGALRSRDRSFFLKKGYEPCPLCSP